MQHVAPYRRAGTEQIGNLHRSRRAHHRARVRVHTDCKNGTLCVVVPLAPHSPTRLTAPARPTPAVNPSRPPRLTRRRRVCHARSTSQSPPPAPKPAPTAAGRISGVRQGVGPRKGRIIIRYATFKTKRHTLQRQHLLLNAARRGLARTVNETYRTAPRVAPLLVPAVRVPHERPRRTSLRSRPSLLRSCREW